MWSHVRIKDGGLYFLFILCFSFSFLLLLLLSSNFVLGASMTSQVIVKTCDSGVTNHMMHGIL